jgi:adenosylcobinamide-GDP ribazoletransferase
MIQMLKDMALALQFMTRVPVRLNNLEPSRLSRAAAWFPFVGLLVGGMASLAYILLIPHLVRPVCALIVLLVMVLVTGGLHEDGLADCADAFGGGWTKEDRLRILKDSRIGSFGAIALILSFGIRGVLLTTIPANQALNYLISAQVLSRWTSLPLGITLPSALGTEGQGGRLAGKISWTAAAIGTFITAVVLWYFLRASAWQPTIAVATVTFVSGMYYHRRLGGITGDCMGATIQISEVAVYLCGAWMR